MQIKELVNEFGQAARRSKEAGFDGVQIHGAHGYLLSKFLSPVYNKRVDAYGGSAEKRAKIVVDILNEIKCVCGKDYPVWTKLSAEDFGCEEGAMDFEHTKVTATLLDRAGIDAIEVSGRTSIGELTPARSKKYEVYHLGYADQLTQLISTPIILVGGIRQYGKLEEIITKTKVEAVALSSPLIRETDLVKRLRKGDRSSAQCVACNGCLNPQGIQCVFHLRGDELEHQKAFLRQLKATK